MKQKYFFNNNLKSGLSIVVLFCAVVTFMSCKKFLDREPLDQISQANFWRKSTDLNSYIVGMYTYMPGDLNSSGVGYLGADWLSDNMENTVDYSRYMNGENSVVPTAAGSGGWSWSDIRNINVFFDNYRLCEDPFSTWKRYLGEACFIKAYLYHLKVKRFGGVPWYSNTIQQNDTVALLRPRDARAVVVDSILNLLDSAISYLPLRSASTVTRLNKESALILKSRIALYEGSWAKYHANYPEASGVDANAMFNKVIDAYNALKTINGTYASIMFKGAAGSEYADLFNKSDYTAVKEVTLARNYSRGQSLVNNTTYLIIGDAGLPYGGFGYTYDLVRSYLDKNGNSIDVSLDTNRGLALLTSLSTKLDPRFKQSVFIPGDLINVINGVAGIPPTRPFSMAIEAKGTTGYCPKKGYNSSFALTSPPSDPMLAGICFRQSEILLNYAEAFIELNGTYPNLADNIDLLRARVNMPSLTSVKPVVQSWWPNYGYPVSDPLAVIRQERRIELAGEGYRTDDWMRWRAHALFAGKTKKGLKIKPSDYTTAVPALPVPTFVDANGYIDRTKGIASMAAGYQFNAGRDYLYPIPLGDLLLNRNLTQTPGW
jgi:hypothetical protein